MTILSNEELILLTGGLKQGAAQCRWIERELGFKPPRKVDGHPMITGEQINGSIEPQRRNPQFNWTKPM